MRAVFLDRDGTITKSDGYFYKHEQLEYLDNLAEAVKILNKNFLVIVITNQPVVARGFCTEDDVNEIHEKLIQELELEGAKINAVYFCPHHPEQHDDVPENAKKYRIECYCRKPGIGLIEQAARDFNIDIKNSFFIGDTTRDIKTAENAGCISILVKTGQSGNDGKYDVSPDYVCEDLIVAANLINKIENTGAVILAGGIGERMRPLTEKIPKPMLPIKGKPIIEHQIDLLRMYGIRDIVICGYYLFDQIKNYLGDGSNFGVKIKYIEESQPLGTGGAVKNAKNEIKWDNFILFNADIATNLNVGELVKFHSKNNPLATQVLRISDHPFDSDTFELDDNNKIINFLGKGQSGIKTCNTGIAMLNKDILNYIPDGVCNIEKDVISKIISTGRVFGHVSNEYFKDIGTLERYEKAQVEFS